MALSPEGHHKGRIPVAYYNLVNLYMLVAIPDIVNVRGNILETGYIGCIRNLRISPTNELRS